MARSSSGDSTPTSIREVCPPIPFPFLPAARNRTPKPRCMLSVLGSDHVFCLLNFDVFAKIIGCTCARPCPILGPPLLASLIQICALTVRSCSALAPFSLFRSSLGEIFTCLQCLAYCFSTKQLSCGIRAGGIGVRRSNDWLCWVLGLWAFW